MINEANAGRKAKFCRRIWTSTGVAKSHVLAFKKVTWKNRRSNKGEREREREREREKSQSALECMRQLIFVSCLWVFCKYPVPLLVPYLHSFHFEFTELKFRFHYVDKTLNACFSYVIHFFFFFSKMCLRKERGKGDMYGDLQLYGVNESEEWFKTIMHELK